jgi:kumamolisin
LVTVLMRRRPSSTGLHTLLEGLSTRPPQARQHLSHAEFAATYGADPADLEKVEEFAHEYDLDVVEASVAQRRVVLSGTAAALSNAFGVYLARYEHPSGSYRGRIGPVHVPDDLAPIIEGVFGLDDRPQAHPHFRFIDDKAGDRAGAVQSRAQGTSYTPPQLARLYDFPASSMGSGQCIAIIELGGGYRTADLRAYFSRLGIPKPRIKSRSVHGGHNRPEGNPNSADAEVMLDIEVAGAVAPGAMIVVYFAPNTDAGFLSAITTAIHDARNHPSVISISWGAPEASWTTQAMQAMDQAFQDAAALGVTVCCAAGDDGSSDIRDPRQDDGQLHADFPASSPYALACGGTRLQGSGSTITNEVVWNEGRNGGATGGGVSEVFELPGWQASAHIPPSGNSGGHIGRGLPDVAGDADPATGYQIQVDGQQAVIGGTSAVAPLWAGLVAVLNEHLGHTVGYLNPVLYSLPPTTGAFHDITTGDNDITGHHGAYPARPGWDACTGWGSPDGAKLLQALTASA